MANTPIDERRFTDEEVREILKKAVEKAPSRGLVKSDGLSLEELKAIGGEVGIDPARLEDAARTLVRGSGTRPRQIIGGPTVLNFERKVEGEFDPADTPEIISIIRRTMGRQGEVDELHGTLEWRAKGESGERYVTVSSREGTTTISGSANLLQAAIVTFVPAGVIGAAASIAGLLTALNNASGIGVIAVLVLFTTLYSILRTIFGKVSASEAAKLQKVVDELARLTEGSGD